MVDKDDDSGSSNSALPGLHGSTIDAAHKLVRSASWSSSPPDLQKKCARSKELYLNVRDPDISGPRISPSSFLTPRTQQSLKGRSCLPPLQPLTITRRSLDEWPNAGSDDLGEWLLPPTPGGNKNGERLKVDVSSAGMRAERNVGSMSNSIAFFDKECSRVAQHLFLGGNAVAKDRDLLKKNGITHVLNCVGFACPEYFKSDFIYKTLWLQDSPSEDITCILYDVFDYFEDVREQGGRIFVHCCQGVSRSTSLVIAYLMWREGQSFDDAFQFVKSARGIANPNMGFACQLLQCQKRVHSFPLSPSSLLRVYRIAPHSLYDPLHLVPRMIPDPSPSALDSRGAFIVHIPSAIFVWIGKKCDATLEREAKASACQIVRYEKLQGPITRINEGEEPDSFWDVFTKFLQPETKHVTPFDIHNPLAGFGSGERRVSFYDNDYDIYKKAIKGELVNSLASSENVHETLLSASSGECSWSMLRLKFVPDDMMGFISTPPAFEDKLFSDSRALMNLSSSPSCSPSSFTSPSSGCECDSSCSSKCSTDSSLNSPEESFPWPHISKLSDMIKSHHTMRNYFPQLNDCRGTCDNYIAHRNISQPASSMQGKSFPSLAERRGSLSKLLKLPLLSNVEKVPTTPKYVPEEEGEHGAFKNDFMWCNNDNKEIVLECKAGISRKRDPVEQVKMNTQADFASNGCSCTKKLPDNSCKEMTEDFSSRTTNLGKYQVYQLHSLERVPSFGIRSFDSKAAFAIIAPSVDVVFSQQCTVYLWVGRYCNLLVDVAQEETSKTDVQHIHWYQIASYFISQMGLPKGIPIKIVKENEEPADFLELFV